MAELHRLGLLATPLDLASVVRAFRESDALIAGLVLPWDRPASDADLALDPEQTTAGALWNRHAECTWRVEGDRAALTILSDAELDGLDLESVACEVHDDPPVRWRKAPFVASGGHAHFHARLYLIDAAPAHRRLVAEED